MASAGRTTHRRGLDRFTEHYPPVDATVAGGLAVLVCLVAGLGGLIWGLLAAVVAVMFAVVPVAGRSPYRWVLVARANYRRRWDVSPPMTVINDRRPGGVRCHDGITITAVRVLGKYVTPTVLTGAATSVTHNILQTAEVTKLLHQELGLTLNSFSIICHGSRTRADGDYARIYDTFIGPPPYMGQLEQWIIVRTDTSISNLDSLCVRDSVAKAALAATQRCVNALRTQGVRAEVATETDLANLDEKLGGDKALALENRGWQAVRTERGWLSSFYYPPQFITDADLSVVWARRYDSVTQNITMYPDGRCTATVTIRGPQIIAPPPNVVLSSLPGEQAAAVAANRALPAELVGAPASVAAGPPCLALPVRDSGVLIGVLDDGHRLVLPFTDPGAQLKIHIGADPAIHKRLILRAAAAGERVTIHTKDARRWKSMAMPGVIISDEVKPAAGTTISVTDLTVTPSPPPATTITVAGEDPGDAHVTISQVGDTHVVVTVNDAHHDERDQPRRRPRSWRVGVELFDVENPYLDIPSHARGTA